MHSVVRAARPLRISDHLTLIFMGISPWGRENIGYIGHTELMHPKRIKIPEINCWDRFALDAVELAPFLGTWGYLGYTPSME